MAAFTRSLNPPNIRFWKYVIKSSACWIWNGYVNAKTGYGYFGWKSHGTDLAHRYSWILHYGEIPAGMEVCHKCDNPPCVRPDHLFLGSPLDNYMDRLRKGRHTLINPLFKRVLLPTQKPFRLKLALSKPCANCQTIFTPARYRGKYCTSCARLVTCFKRTQTPEERFWKHVNKTDTCWLWTGGVTRHDSRIMYGKFRDEAKITVSTHRYSWRIHYGPIQDGFVVCHRCDNGLCVRPDHLFLGTHSDNTQDMMAKGRHRHRPYKLTLEQAVEIKNSLANGGTVRGLARKLGVSRQCVLGIARGKTWRDLPNQAAVTTCPSPKESDVFASEFAGVLPCETA